MTKFESKVVAGFLWNQLGLDPEETIGHCHYTRLEFADELVKMLGGEK